MCFISKYESVFFFRFRALVNCDTGVVAPSLLSLSTILLCLVLFALLYTNSPSVSAASHAAPWLEAGLSSYSASAAAFELLELPVPPCFDEHFARVCPLSPQRPHEYARFFPLTGPFSSQSAWRIPAFAGGRPRGGGSAMGIFNAAPLRTFSLAP